ncbi:sensor histidine kinase [Paenibacillaceae bacterium]|nr:sensor histidine kinase [Paenibacillaceae bacterium]
MNVATKLSTVFLLLLVLLFSAGFAAAPVWANDGHSLRQSERITEWGYAWIENSKPLNTRAAPITASAQVQGFPSLPNQWTVSTVNSPIAKPPKDVNSVWLRIDLPVLDWSQPAIYIPKIYGQQIEVWAGGQLIHQVQRDYVYDVNRILLQLEHGQGEQPLYIKASSVSDRLGLNKEIIIGSFSSLQPFYVKQDLLDVILGSSSIFIAIIMMICSIYLRSEQYARWISLSLVILTIGLLVMSYSPFMYTFYSDYGMLLFNLFDIALLVLLPSITYFFEKMFDQSNMVFVTRFRKFQVAFSIFCAIFSLFNHMNDFRFFKVHFFFTVELLGVTMLFQLILLIGYTTVYATRGNREALILAMGFTFCALMGIADLLWFYYKTANYELYLWKWGVVGFMISLIIMLGRRFAIDHQRLINYSKELELFNTRLQRSEKMEIISGLAASVAHEVRNPLQVTRGFLQLLTNKAGKKDKYYMSLAIEELDRASNIITDFLTFAKPELEQIVVMDIAEEMKQIEGILVPLANLQGGKIILDIPNNLFIRGNSSKLKQAFINMIKNSIEALNGSGQINIWAYSDKKEVVIHIKDNGEGMNATELAKLGEPYFSNKSKGTGLGLMVTFRIIEVMQGKLEFRSEKGIGTEAIIRFPAHENAQ